VSKESGFLQLRRGVFDHIRDGRLTQTEALCFIYMLTQADTRSGVWNGSAGALAGELVIPPRTARNVLESLDGRYIKRFATPGLHFCYPILMHKFLITDGEHKGEHLNALESASPTDLAYFPREHNVGQDGKDGVEHSAAQKRSKTVEGRRKKKEGAPAPPSLSFSGRHFTVTQRQDALLGEAFPWIDRPAEYRKADSWLEANPDRRPRKANRFLHNWFSRITQPKGVFRNGKPTVGDNLRVTLATMRAAEKPS
jgi:hypothetical protein